MSSVIFRCVWYDSKSLNTLMSLRITYGPHRTSTHDSSSPRVPSEGPIPCKPDPKFPSHPQKFRCLTLNISKTSLPLGHRDVLSPLPSSKVERHPLPLTTFTLTFYSWSGTSNRNGDRSTPRYLQTFVLSVITNSFCE